MLRILLIIIGLAEGIVVGGAIVAFLVILDLIPRVAQFTGTQKFIPLYENVLTAGVFLAALQDTFHWFIRLPPFFPILFGLLMGVFVGLLAGALAEVLNVLPIMSRRFYATQAIAIFVYAITVGKVVGSLIYWIVPGLW
jgi:stage V sporulation protein AB